jgi:hypothetical protein
MSEMSFDKWLVVNNLQTTLNNYNIATNNIKLFVASLVGKEIKVRYNHNPLTWFFPIKEKITEEFIKELVGNRYHVANVNCHENIITKTSQKIEWLKASIDRSFFDMPSGTIYKMKTDDFLGIEVELEKKDGDIILKFKDKGVVLGIIDYSSKHCKRVV